MHGFPNWFGFIIAYLLEISIAVGFIILAVFFLLRAQRKHPDDQYAKDIALLREADDFAQFSDQAKPVREALRRVIRNE